MRVVVQTSSITISNFGFENPTQSPRGYTPNPSNASWTFAAGNGSAGISDNVSDVTNGNPNAPDGHQVAWISGTGSITQSLSGFNAGITYVITVSAAARGNFHPSAQSFNITIDGAVVGSYAPPVSFTSYQDYTASYSCPSSGNHTVGLVGTGASNSTILLDNVRITLVPASVIAGNNMGFELPSLSGGYTTAPTGASWAFGGSAGITGNGNAITNGNPIAPEGVQSAWISGTGTITQSLSGFTQGVTYAITVSAAERGNFNPTAQSFNITVDGNSISSFAPSIVSTSYLDYTMTFVASSSGSHTIGFTGTGASNSTILLDNVRITVQPASISGSNMGFELPSLSGGYTPNPTGASWTFAAGNGSAGITGNGNDITRGNPDAPEPVQVAWISGTGSITQSLSGFVPGVTYSITVSAAERQNYNPSAQSFSITVDGAAIKNIAPTTSDITYTEYTGTFVGGASGTHTIGFVGTGASNSTILIDNVRIKAIVTGPDFGFELPGLSGSYQANPSGTPWTFSGSAGISGNGNAVTSGNPNAPEGVQVGYLSGTGSVSQRVYGFVPGTTYSITVSAAERGNYNPAPQSFNILVDGVVAGSYSPLSTATSYSDYSVTYQATGGNSHTIAFAGTGASTSTILIDNIRISKSTSTVGITDKPEPGWASGTVPSAEGASGSGAGPSSSMSVTLPSSVEENDPGADIGAYNPYGPSVSFDRLYRSALVSSSYATNYSSAGLSPGWVHNYDIVIDSNTPGTWSNLTLKYPNRSAETLMPVLQSGTPTGAFAHTTGVPYIVTGVASGTTGQWTSITITNPDRSQMVFMPNPNASPANANHYVLTKIYNIVQHYVTFIYDSGNRLTEIDNDAASPAKLLLLAYDANHLLQTVTDYDGTSTAQRQVTYTFDSHNNLWKVTNLADLVASTTSITRWQYEYQLINGYWYLYLVKSPDPSNPANFSVATVVYDPYTAAVTKHIGAGGAQQCLDYSNASLGNIGISYYQQNASIPDFAITQNFDTVTGNRNTGSTDAANHRDIKSYAGSINAYLPKVLINRNNQVFTPNYNNYGLVSDATSPRGIQIVNTISYPSDFLIGQITQSQVKNGSNYLTPTSFDYYLQTDGFKNGLLKTITSPLPGSNNHSSTVTTTIDYTSLGNVLKVIKPGPNGNITIDYAYTGYTGYTKPDGETIGEPVQVKVSGTGASQYSYYHYDIRGRVIASIDGMGYETDYTYNASDQVVTVTLPPTTGTARAHIRYIYEYDGGPLTYEKLYSESDPNEINTPFRQTVYTYGPEGELVTVTDLKGIIAHYYYDSLFRVAALSDGNGNITTYQYDAVGTLHSISYPLSSGSYFDKTVYGYDNDYNLTTRTDGNGNTTTYNRDSVDSRVNSITYPSTYSSLNVTYGYDYYNRLTSQYNGNATYTYSLDDLGNLLTKTTDFAGGPQGQVLTYDYYPDGSRKSLLLPAQVGNPRSVNNGYITYFYDNIGRLTSMNLPWYKGTATKTTNVIQSFTYGYQANGWLTSSDDGIYLTSYNCNGRGFLRSLGSVYDGGYPDTSTQVTSYDMSAANAYDAVGNRLLENASILPIKNTQMGGTTDNFSHLRTLTYDTRNELTYESIAPANGGSNILANNFYQYFDYDLSGNPYNFRGLSAGLHTNTFNIDNQISNTGFVYDGNGNATTHWNATYGFDIENRLTSMSSPSFSAAYGPDDLRIQKVAGSTNSYYLTDEDGLPVVEETYSGGTANIYVIYGRGADGLRQVYYPTDVTHYSFGYDPEGSVVMRNYSGNLYGQAIDVSVYDAYGEFVKNERASDKAWSSHRDMVGFQGQWGAHTDWEAQLNPTSDSFRQYSTLMTHRYYDPRIGRFINRDPIGYSGGINQYAYAGGNPIMGSDISGLRPLNANDTRIIKKLSDRIGATTDSDGTIPNTAELNRDIGYSIAAIKAEIAKAPGNGQSDPPNLQAALWAIDHLGDRDYGLMGNPNDGYLSTRSGEWKCNIFAADCYALGAKTGFNGAHGVPTKVTQHLWIIHHWPASANALAGTGSIAHFPRTATPVVGDIVAFGRKGPHLGHTTISLDGGLLIYAGQHGVKIQTDRFVGSSEPFDFYGYRHYVP